MEARAAECLETYIQKQTAFFTTRRGGLPAPRWLWAYYADRKGTCCHYNAEDGPSCTSCAFKHICVLCGSKDHAAFSRSKNETFCCPRLVRLRKSLQVAGMSIKQLNEQVLRRQQSTQARSKTNNPAFSQPDEDSIGPRTSDMLVSDRLVELFGRTIGTQLGQAFKENLVDDITLVHQLLRSSPATLEQDCRTLGLSYAQLQYIAACTVEVA